MTPLRQRMTEELQRRNYTRATIESYILAVKDFAQYFGKSPMCLGSEDVRRYQLHLINEKRLAPNTVKVRMSALRFFYWRTLKRRDLHFDDLPLTKTPVKLPVVLSPDEVTRLIEGAANLKHRTMLMVLYATGLRRAELARLKVSDIDSKLMVIHIHEGKGQRDRDLPMTAKLLQALREYWRWSQSKVYLFPSPWSPSDGEEPITPKSIYHACKKGSCTCRFDQKDRTPYAVAQLRDPVAGLRSRPAHHPVSLGHSSLKHTVVYLHLSQRHMRAATNPLDQITLNTDGRKPPSEENPS